MKKRIFLIFVLLTISFTVICALALTRVYYDFYSDNIKSELRAEASLIKDYLQSNPNNADYKTLVTKIDSEISPYTRISVIDATGSVLFDTDATAETLENHLNRPEVTSAQNTGSGEAVRYSATLGKDAYYYALKMDNSGFLRLSRQLESIRTVFSGIIPYVVIILLLLIIASLIAASFLTKSIVKPVNLIAERLDNPSDEQNGNLYDIPIYDEMIPFIRKIRMQNERINQQILTLKAERDTISDISANMREGLILLDQNKHIVSINNSASLMLHINPNHNHTGENISKLTRNVELLTFIDQTLAKNEEFSFTDENQGHYLRYYISPVGIARAERAEGVMILILDVSQEIKAEKVRQDFAANVSHELKTPLTSINGYAELISGGMIQNEADIQKSAAAIKKEAGRLLLLINEIMRLSEIESGLIDQDTMTQVYLPEILSETIHSLEPSMEAKKIRLKYSSEEITIKANRQMIFELLYNLIDNAVKYNQENGGISILIQKKEGFAQMIVSDTGIGIDPLHQERIFERFYRVDKSRSKQGGGTGLGLSIVKHVVEYHHGKIRLESAPGQGTTITVDLPE